MRVWRRDPLKGAASTDPPRQREEKGHPFLYPEDDQGAEEPACEALQVSSEQKGMVRSPGSL